jgi:ribosomal protein S12 methylthiotransferase accessory factor
MSELSSALKTYTHAQDKVVDPQTTIQRALTRLRRLQGTADVRLDERPSSVEGAYAFTSISDFINASGKGLTAEQAQASALMELVERTSWLHFDCRAHPDYEVTTYHRLAQKGARLPDPAYFLANFREWPKRDDLQTEILELPLKWITGRTLVDQKPFHYPINWHNITFSSNGLAAGNCLVEAIAQALCEVIERENVYRFFMECRPAPDVDLDSMHNPLLCEVLDAARAKQIDLKVKDITYDLGVPTFIVRGTRLGDVGTMTFEGVGQGCHPDPEKALMRALSEYFEGYTSTKNVQEKLPLRWDLLPKGTFGFHALHNPHMFETSGGRVALADLPNISDADIRQEIRTIAGLLRQRGYTPVVIDKTHAPLDIPVVRLFVPGMRCCIVVNCYNPIPVLVAVCHEVGNLDGAAKYGGAIHAADPLRHMFESERLPREVLPHLAQVVLSQPSTSYDYRQYILYYLALKKAASADLEHLRAIFVPSRDTNTKRASLQARLVASLTSK